MLHEKFFLTIASKSQITLTHAIFFNTVTGEFIVAKSGIKNNNLKPFVITANGTIPENGEYSDNFLGANIVGGVVSEFYKYVDLLNSLSNLKVDLIDVIVNERESILVDCTSANDAVKEEPKAVAVKEPKAKVVKVDDGVLKSLSELEKIVLAKCCDIAGEGSIKGNNTGFSFRVCEGNLSLAGAFSTLQRKGYITTFFDKINKRKEKFFKVIRNVDGKLL